MSKVSARLVALVVVLIVQSSLLICQGEGCWNFDFSLSSDNPLRQALFWLLMRMHIDLSTIQCLAQALFVVEGVILLNYLAKGLCCCTLLAFQAFIVALGISLCFQITQEDLWTTIFKFKTSVDDFVRWKSISNAQ